MKHLIDQSVPDGRRSRARGRDALRVRVVHDRRSVLDLMGFIVWSKVVLVCIREDVPHAVLAIALAIVATCIFALAIDGDQIRGIPRAVARWRHRV